MRVKNILCLKKVRDIQYTNQAVTKIWGVIIEYVETNKTIRGVEFAKKWKVLKLDRGKLDRDFYSRIDPLCAEKITSAKKSF